MLKLQKFPRSLKCPRHRNYNGRGVYAIRGGCPICHAIMEAGRLADELAAAVAKVDELAAAARGKKPARRRADDPSEAEQRGTPERTPFDDTPEVVAQVLAGRPGRRLAVQSIFPLEVIELEEAGR